MAKKKRKMAGGKKVRRDPKSSPPAKQKSKPDSKKSDKESGGANLRVQRYIALIGFGFCGTLAGYLTGANQLAPMPAEAAHSILSALEWTSYSVGDQTIETAKGIQSGFMGGVIGSTLGFSVLMKPIYMLASWVVAGACLFVGLQLGGQPLLGGLGWLAGFLPFWLRELRASRA